ERVAQVAAHVEAVDEEDLEALDLRLAQALEPSGGELLVHLDEHLTRLRVDDVVRGDLAVELLRLDGHALELGLLHLADGRPRELGVLLDEDVVTELDVASGALPGEELVLDALRVLVALLDVDGLRRVEVVEEILRR